MRNKMNFFWTYTIILFSTAFVLILFSSLSAGRQQELKKETQTQLNNVNKSADKLAKENSKLKKQADTAESLSEQVLSLSEKNKLLQTSADAVIEAQRLCNEQKFEEAQAELLKADRDVLTQKLKDLYDKLLSLINSKLN